MHAVDHIIVVKGSKGAECSRNIPHIGAGYYSRLGRMTAYFAAKPVFYIVPNLGRRSDRLVKRFKKNMIRASVSFRKESPDFLGLFDIGIVV